MSNNHVDVLIIGAGLSGIGAACHLTRKSPNRSYAILERRERIGGTWDLFKYPGIRSDSDMFTLGYSFRPWTDPKVLADGPSIRNYIKETADEFGVSQHIHYGLTITGADWSSDEKIWTVTARQERHGETEKFRSRFLIGCTGYYNYDQGYLPEFPGMERFQGTCVHPQQWPEDLDYRNKKVVVIQIQGTLKLLLV